MPYLKIWVHFVWTTKNRIPYLSDDIRQSVFVHIRENAELKKIRIIELNGYSDHVHALISIGGVQSASEIMKKIKGESSFWINKNKLTRLRFGWQDDFYAVSVGLSHCETLKHYIRNQEAHHSKVNLKEELDNLIEEYNLHYMKD